MQERSNDRPPHPFELEPDEYAANYGPGVQIGAPDADRGIRLDEHAPGHVDDEYPLDAGELAELERRRTMSARRQPAGGRPAARTRTTTAGKPRGRSTGRGRKGGEIALGAIVAAVLLAFGGYWLARELLGLDKSIAFVIAGYVGGICSGGVVWPLWRAFRHAVGRYITPKAAR
ncbi:hypothetical protein [Nonomuraea sp. NEAU-A123]|uniref:hypothetical protein n=1 Tax=Nonomuraea sp. NEAU-A123 TaxID=2839649 RepID=UPI001BE3D92C|nr:hypothetical protein [Nonomuraea sp. NEAU-A123]MBT2226291.1 hypothetical protein [Nonomuraea sp. NEAU-A123]